MLASSYPKRWRRFFAALAAELRTLGVVVMLSDEMKTLEAFEATDDGVTSTLDNVVTLRHDASKSKTRRMISVSKMREGGGDSSLRDFSIGARGFTVGTGPGTTTKTATKSPRRQRP